MMQEQLEARYLLVKFGCPHCRKMLKVLRWVNLALPQEKKIIVVDCFHWESYGIQLEPIMEKFQNAGFDGYPFLYISKGGMDFGIKIDPTSDPEILKRYLIKLLEDEF